MTGSSRLFSQCAPVAGLGPGASRNIHAQTPLFRNEAADAFPHARHEPGLLDRTRETSHQSVCGERYFCCVNSSFTNSVLILSKISDTCSALPTKSGWQVMTVTPLTVTPCRLVDISIRSCRSFM